MQESRLKRMEKLLDEGRNERGNDVSLVRVRPACEIVSQHLAGPCMHAAVREVALAAHMSQWNDLSLVSDRFTQLKR